MEKRAASEIAVWIVIAITVMFILSGCTQERPAIVRPPVELTECADEPQTPDIPAKDGTEATRDVRDGLVWRYVLALHGAFIDCKADVVGIKAWDQGLR
jgi:hypothetical protein